MDSPHCSIGGVIVEGEETDLIVISEEEGGERLDKILAARFQEVKSRTYFQYLIDEQKVLLNGVPVKKRIRPKAGDEVEIQFICTPELSLEPEPIPLDILYEDEHLLIVNKPVGMVVHPAAGNWSGTFVNALLYHCKISHNDRIRPGIVHRLDKDTSGLLLAAKTSEAHQRLTALFSSRNIQKEYLAICVGKPKDDIIDLPIGRHPVHRKKMAVSDTGKNAITTCKVLSYNAALSLVQLGLLTGRTHQIRVHLQHGGTPILGDLVYGSDQANRKYHANRQMLHASKLEFVHPLTGKLLTCEAPLPNDMKEIIVKQKLGSDL